MRHDKKDYESLKWEHTINMFSLWMYLKKKHGHLSEYSEKIVQQHRDSFPHQKKVFDEVEKEIMGDTRQKS